MRGGAGGRFTRRRDPGAEVMRVSLRKQKTPAPCRMAGPAPRCDTTSHLRERGSSGCSEWASHGWTTLRLRLKGYTMSQLPVKTKETLCHLRLGGGRHCL